MEIAWNSGRTIEFEHFKLCAKVSETAKCLAASSNHSHSCVYRVSVTAGVKLIHPPGYAGICSGFSCLRGRVDGWGPDSCPNVTYLYSSDLESN